MTRFKKGHTPPREIRCRFGWKLEHLAIVVRIQSMVDISVAQADIGLGTRTLYPLIW